MSPEPASISSSARRSPSHIKKDTQLPTSLARVSEVTQDGESELLERRAARDDLLKDGDGTGDGCFFLSNRAESTEVEESVDDVVLDLL